MTTIQFPRSYTEEEEMLLKKYAKLKKKKKALQAMRTPKQDPGVSKEPPPVSRSAVEAAEIKEDIKKLVKAGAIRLDTDREKTAFKRKIKDVDRVERSMTSSFHPVDSGFDLEPPSAKKVKSLYDSFVPGNDTTSGSDNLTDDAAEKTPDRSHHDDRRPPRRDFPKRGNTICINAHGVNEKFVRDHFSKFGEIINLKLEVDRKRCFLSFADNDSADKAITEMDCTLVGGIYLKVMLARRQPNFNVQVPPETGPTKPTVWGNMAQNRSQKGEGGMHKDAREMVTYDADDLF